MFEGDFPVLELFLYVLFGLFHVEEGLFVFLNTPDRVGVIRFDVDDLCYCILCH